MKIKNGKIELSEIDTQRQICKFLESKKYTFTRLNNVGVWDEKNKCHRKNKWQMKGLPDIMVFNVTVKNKNISICDMTRKMIAIEVKSKNGKQSQDQFLFGCLWETCNQQYLLVRSLDEVVKYFNESVL
jgi:hypothetical protein